MPEPTAPEPTLRDFLLPDLAEGLEDATIIQWLAAVGDHVVLNQPLCLVETAKATVEVPSPHAGTIVALGCDEGDTLRVGTLLARIDATAGTAPPGPERPGAEGATSGRPGLTPAAEPTLVGYGHDAAIDRSRRSRRGTTSTAGGRPLAKPPVRLLARRLGIELGRLTPGSGPGGIITRHDVQAAAQDPAATAPRPTVTRADVPAAAVAPSTGATHPIAPPTVSTIPVRGLRARIAERLSTSRAEIPDATCSVTADCSRLLEVRAALNERAQRRGLDPIVTPFSLLSYLAVQALAAAPVLNATFDDRVPEIRPHDAVHLGIGTATARGLVVTVARNAGQLTVHDLSAEMARLTDGARAGTLGPGDLQGSTFTISNFGALGLDEGVPIINYPEAAILGVGSIRPRPHVVDGEVVARPTVSLTLAFDHRVADGAEAGRFLSDLRELAEAPELALLLR
jgi:2-oxoisovalerate dehydrogenase E2 component (dihydrolipoyl transacylase)